MKNIIIILCLVVSSLCWAQTNEDNLTKNEKAILRVGDIIQISLPLAAGLSTVILKDKEGTWQFVKSFGTTFVLTFGLKVVVNKSRSYEVDGGHAFPSGHTSTAFSGASFIQRRYGWKYGVPAYALAGLCAYTRLRGEQPKHDGWDIAGGIIVGVGSTYIFTTPYQRDHYELSFSTGRDAYMLGFNYKF
jgi:membrane-associated PAP2 superfamily phosphatase